MPIDVPVGQIQAKTFSTAQIEKELAQMKAEREALEERLKKLEEQLTQRKELTNEGE